MRILGMRPDGCIACLLLGHISAAGLGFLLSASTSVFLEILEVFWQKRYYRRSQRELCMPEHLVKICNPACVDGQIDWSRTYHIDNEKMGLIIELCRKNVEQQTGEPFGAAIFLCESGQLIAVEVSQVVGQYNSVQHA